MKLWLTLIVLLGIWNQQASTADAAGIVVDDRLNSPTFWQQNSSDGAALRMTPEEVRTYNQRIIAKSPNVYDLAEYSPVLTADALKKLIQQANPISPALYVNGQRMTLRYHTSLLHEMNLYSITSNVPVRYGIVVRRANLRSFPACEAWFSSTGDTDFDILQETAVDPSEPVIVLHTSTSGKFHYIQMRNYRGWLQSDDIALTKRNTWLAYAKMPDFLVVTANRYILPTSNEQIQYQMGAKLPLKRVLPSGYLITVPRRAMDGTLREDNVHLAKSSALHRGFLPYTRNQLIAQSFRFLHDPYGWGGLKDSVDCSSFIAAVYRTVGVELPRNADEQELTSGTYTSFGNSSTLERKKRLHSQHPGDALFFNGHTMLYLGEADSIPYIIHSLGSHTRLQANGAKEKMSIMRVVVSDLSLQRYNGVSFLDALTGAISFQ